MSATNFPYPVAPSSVQPEKLQPSPAFKKQVVHVLISIIAFLLLYVLLVVAALALAAGCVWLGLFVIFAAPKGFVILIGVGLMALGVLIVWFLLKFLFAVSKDDMSHAIEVTEATQPKLFAFIRQLVAETGTQFPKKIFLTPDVNASVFYNSSFWSMFFPVRKNLNIGLGLVNTINVAEFKAVMAHEFGHFSQRSMKLGSFVYQVNRIIYNMLYDNSGYSKLLEGFANISGIFALFAKLTAFIIGQIQSLLQAMYKFVNKRYMSLSREMEFHADTVAAAVAGGNHLITALRRIEMGDYSYNEVINEYNSWIKDNQKSANLFSDHRYIHQLLANDMNIQQATDGLPMITDDVLNHYNKSRVVFKNQWASHPERADREAHLQQLQWNTPDYTESAWTLFVQPQELQQQMTEKLYRNVEWENAPTVAGTAEFEKTIEETRSKYRLPQSYKGLYDGRVIEPFDLQKAVSELPLQSAITFADICTESNATLQKQINSNQNDIATLQAIANKQIDCNSFDFDGAKYKAKDATAIATQLQQENDSLADQLKHLDKSVFQLAYIQSAEKSTVINSYQKFFDMSKTLADYAAVSNAVHQRFAPLLNGQTLSVEDAARMTNSFTSEEEPQFKKQLNLLLELSLLANSKANALAFIDKHYIYFHGDSFLDNELQDLFGLIPQVHQELIEKHFLMYKNLLEQQESWLQA